MRLIKKGYVFFGVLLRNLNAYQSIMIVILLSSLFSCQRQVNKTSSISTLPYFNTPDFTPVWDKATHKIPNFSFVNQNEDLITNKTFEDKIYIADFFFASCPGICPKLTNNMKKLQEEYQNDNTIMLLSHTVMPWRDSIAVLKDYANKYDIDSKKWHLVTGNKDSLYNIARYGYFADEDFTKTQDKNNFIHTENFILIDKKGFIRGVYNGTIGVDVERLKRHIEILKQEKKS